MLLSGLMWQKSSWFMAMQNNGWNRDVSIWIIYISVENMEELEMNYTRNYTPSNNLPLVILIYFSQIHMFIPKKNKYKFSSEKEKNMNFQKTTLYNNFINWKTRVWHVPVNFHFYPNHSLINVTCNWWHYSLVSLYGKINKIVNFGGVFQINKINWVWGNWL